MILNKIALCLSGASLVLFIGGMILSNRGIISANMGATLFALGGLIGLCAVFASAFVLVFTKSYITAMIGCLGLLPLVAVTAGVSGAFNHPQINDITTDTENIPAYVHAPTIKENAGRDMSLPPDFIPHITGFYAHITPLSLNLPPGDAFQRALDVARLRMPGWTITREDAAAGVFEAVAETKLFKWKDDVVVRVSPGAAGGSRVDMRSKSRDGKSDLGANARRIEQYFEKLKALDVSAP